MANVNFHFRFFQWSGRTRNITNCTSRAYFSFRATDLLKKLLKMKSGFFEEYNLDYSPIKIVLHVQRKRLHKNLQFCQKNIRKLYIIGNILLVLYLLGLIPGKIIPALRV